MQATKEAAAQEALALREEVEHVMARHQERVAKWEQAAAAQSEEGCHGGAADYHVDALNTGKVCDILSQLHVFIKMRCSCRMALQSALGLLGLSAAPQSGCNASQDNA